jgi:uncharacterized protein
MNVHAPAMPLPAWALVTAHGLELRLKIVPGASRDQFAGPLGDRLKLRVAAPPEAGKANAAVLALVGRWLCRDDVQLLAGHASALKTILVPGCRELSLQRLAEVS